MSNEPAEKVHLSPIEFFYLYKTKILIYGGLLVAALLIYAGVQMRQHLRTSGSGALYAVAVTPENFRAVMDQYAGTPAAGNAALRLAQLLRTEGQYDESAAVLRDFIANYPTHPLVCGGWTSLGITLEKKGDMDGALEAYTAAITHFPDSFTTPPAMMAQARIALERGNSDEARRIYTDIAARFNQTLYGMEAMRNLRFIQR